MTPATIVLFDIDGTLLDLKGAGRRAFIRSIEAVFGWHDDLGYLSFAGSTDLNVLEQVMAAHGRVMTDEDSRRFFARLPIDLEFAAGEPAADPVIYPGVRELLERLSADPAVVLALVTGNVEACARIKLRQFNLHNHFVLGAFGNEHADRRRIAALALQRVQAARSDNRPVRGRYLIGDTPHDIDAARAVDARSIAVATGKFSVDELRAAGADHVLVDLADTGHILSVLGLDKGPAGVL
jgi:phosphoglycolate phosphatase-like HAD superfamily hydrolase